MDDLVDAVAELEDLLHPRPPQIEVAVLQANRFVRFELIFDRKRRSFRHGQDIEVVGQHLDLASRHLGVLRSAWPARDLARHANYVFEAQLRGQRFGRPYNDLHSAPAVAQVDERNTSMVATTRDPAVQLDVAAFVGRSKRPTVRSAEAAHASRVGNSVHASSTCSPLDISRICATRLAASSALSRTTHRAPSLLADRIFARRLFAS